MHIVWVTFLLGPKVDHKNQHVLTKHYKFKEYVDKLEKNTKPLGQVFSNSYTNYSPTN